MNEDMADVEPLMRETFKFLAERGINASPSKVSRLVRRYVWAGNSKESWRLELNANERAIISEIESANRFLNSIRIVPGGLPSLGKNR